MKIKNRDYIIMFGTISVILLIGFAKMAIDIRNSFTEIYNKGVVYLNEGKYQKAVECFKEIPNYLNYRDISDLLQEYDTCPECGQVLINEKEQNNE